MSLCLFTMRRLVLTLASLVCTAHARKVQVRSGNRLHSQRETKQPQAKPQAGVPNSVESLARFLLTHPGVAFNPAGPTISGTRSHNTEWSTSSSGSPTAQRSALSPLMLAKKRRGGRGGPKKGGNRRNAPAPAKQLPAEGIMSIPPSAEMGQGIMSIPPPAEMGQGNYAPAPQGNYVPPPQGNYAQPSQGNYAQPPQGNYAQPQGNYAAPPQGNYAPPAQGNYMPPAQGNYAPPPQGSYELGQDIMSAPTPQMSEALMPPTGRTETKKTQSVYADPLADEFQKPYDVGYAPPSNPDFLPQIPDQPAQQLPDIDERIGRPRRARRRGSRSQAQPSNTAAPLSYASPPPKAPPSYASPAPKPRKAPPSYAVAPTKSESSELASSLGGYKSKLKPLNKGKLDYEPEVEQPPVEKFVFRVALGGIVFFVIWLIFVASPAFPVAKPFLLKAWATVFGNR
mmetsp:Transcript_27134/g.49398  ORF Transcript_27134/g.49398 Transcript_27134/m.49398 type:complete len:454 (+) Transcript_27134:44-1405(+)